MLLLSGMLLTATPIAFSQEASRDSLVKAALELIHESHYCALVTVDSDGQPQIRTMNPFPMQDEIVIWFATARDSRKVKEIRNNPRVNVYWSDHTNAKGYVNITGTAEVIDDKELLMKMKRDYWEGIKDWKEIFVLIKVVPKTLEVINYKHNLHNEAVTFRAPVVKL